MYIFIYIYDYWLPECSIHGKCFCIFTYTVGGKSPVNSSTLRVESIYIVTQRQTDSLHHNYSVRLDTRYIFIYIYIYIYIYFCACVNVYIKHFWGGVRGVMVIVVGNGHGDSSSKSWTTMIAFHIALMPWGKGMNPIILPPAMGK